MPDAACDERYAAPHVAYGDRPDALDVSYRKKLLVWLVLKRVAAIWSRCRMPIARQAMPVGSQNFQKRGIPSQCVINQQTPPIANGAAPIANAASIWNHRIGIPAKIQPKGATAIAASAKTTANKTSFFI